MEFLSKELVLIQQDVSTAEEAIKLAGNLLVQEGLVEKSYVKAMLDSFQKNGAYIVLAPGIALPHARPEDGVNTASVSFVSLKNPVVFGHPSNDPVSLIFALGASSSKEHLKILQKLMSLLQCEKNIEKLRSCTNKEEIQTLIGGN